MIKNFLKLIFSEFQLMLKGSVFSFVLYCLLIISCAIFALSLKHQSMGINAPLSFLYIMIFFISLFKVEKIYGQDFDEAKIHQYLLSPFSLEIIVFVKNMMIYFNLIIFFIIFSPLILIILSMVERQTQPPHHLIKEKTNIFLKRCLVKRKTKIL